MNWVSVKERLPMEGQHCWIFGKYEMESIGDFVFDGFYHRECPYYINGKILRIAGWEYNTEMSNYALIDFVSHWMPYFTPSPPIKMD